MRPGSMLWAEAVVAAMAASSLAGLQTANAKHPFHGPHAEVDKKCLQGAQPALSVSERSAVKCIRAAAIL